MLREDGLPVGHPSVAPSSSPIEFGGDEEGDMHDEWIAVDHSQLSEQSMTLRNTGMYTGDHAAVS